MESVTRSRVSPKLSQYCLSAEPLCENVVNRQREWLANRKASKGTKRFLLLLIALDFRLRKLNCQIELTMLPRVLDLPVILQVQLGELQFLPCGDSRLQFRLVLSIGR